MGLINFGKSKKTEKREKGKFIVIDGIDGSGKSTQLEILKSELEVSGYTVQYIHFPKHGSPSAAMVDKYLAGDYGNLSSHAASIFYATDRFDSAPDIRAWLDAGNIVLCDRYVTANAGHQGGKIPDREERIKFFRWLDNLEYGIFNIPKPDLNIILNVPPRAAMEMIKMRTDDQGHTDNTHETSLEHMENSAKSYQDLASLFPNTKLVECVHNSEMLSPEEIHNKVWELVRRIVLKDSAPQS